MSNSSIETNNDTSVIDEETNWSNGDNNAFYENVKVEGLKKLAVRAGLTTGCDIQQLTSYWLTAKNILEAGAGYGRIVDYLLKHQFQGKITAIERCGAQYEHLNKKYGQLQNTKLIHADIRNIDVSNNHFDLILMLWYGIADFAPEEQAYLFIKLKKYLKKNGKLVIDTIPDNSIPMQSQKCGDQTYIMKVDDATIHVHLLNKKEIQEYAKKAGFTNVECIPYQTDTDRERWLHILS